MRKIRADRKRNRELAGPERCDSGCFEYGVADTGLHQERMVANSVRAASHELFGSAEVGQELLGASQVMRLTWRNQELERPALAVDAVVDFGGDRFPRSGVCHCPRVHLHRHSHGRRSERDAALNEAPCSTTLIFPSS